MDYPHQPYIGDVEYAPGGRSGTALYPSATMYPPKITRRVGGSGVDVTVATLDTPQIICSPIQFSVIWRYNFKSKTGRMITEAKEYRPYVVLTFQGGGRADLEVWKRQIFGGIAGQKHTFGETGVTVNQRYYYYPYGQIYRPALQVVCKSMDEIEYEFLDKRYQGYSESQLVLIGVETVKYPWLPYTTPVEIDTHAGLTMGTMHI